MNKVPSEVITRQDDLHRALSSISDIVAIDTEFFYRHTFFVQPCLIQIATPDSVHIVDLLAPLNLSGIERILTDNSVKKIMHGSSEDLNLFHHVFGVSCENVIDTQLAHAFVEKNDKMKYSALVSHYLDVALDEAPEVTTSDWSSRPLSDVQIHYALDDVRYLIPTWNRIHERLIETNRLDWFSEEMACQLRRTAISLQSTVTTLPRLKDLDRSERNKLCRLVEWRESYARRVNRPRQWIASDKLLIDAATTPNLEFDEFQQKFGAKMAPKLLRTLQQMKKLSFEEDIATDQTPSDQALKKRSYVRSIRKVVENESQKLHMSPVILGRLKDIVAWTESYLNFGNFPETFGNWRERILGQQIRKILDNVQR